MSSGSVVPAEQTRGQLQRTLSQQIQKLYREQLDHLPGRISCHLLNDKLLVIIDDSLTQPESLLLEEGDSDLAKQIRDDLDQVIRPKLVDLVESLLERKVADILSDANMTSGRTGIIIIFTEPPQTRSSKRSDETDS